MAQRIVTTMTDDIDGSEANETVVFALDGAAFELDLNEAHAEDLRDVLAPYVGAARRAGSAAKGRGDRADAPRPGSSQDVDSRAVRAWAEANGVQVSARGRLKAEVVQQYRAANL